MGTNSHKAAGIQGLVTQTPPLGTVASTPGKDVQPQCCDGCHMRMLRNAVSQLFSLHLGMLLVRSASKSMVWEVGTTDPAGMSGCPARSPLGSHALCLYCHLVTGASVADFVLRRARNRFSSVPQTFSGDSRSRQGLRSGHEGQMERVGS